MQELMRAIYDVVDDHGTRKIAEGASFSSRTLLSQKANPDYGTHKMNVEELDRILMFTQDFRPLHAWAEKYGFALEKKVQPVAIDVHQALSRAAFEFAEVTVETHAAMADGRVDQVERARILKEIDHAEKALALLKSSVKAAA
jgi:hypothetical protein